MNEADWENGSNPVAMLHFVRANASDRKLRLFAVACCRLLEDYLRIDATRTAVETSERYADGLATENELSKARSAAHNAAWFARHYSEQKPEPWEDPSRRRYYGERLGRPRQETLRRLYLVAFMANTTTRLRLDEMTMLGTDPILARFGPPLLRDVFGNPFRPVSLDPAWLTWHDGLVASMARRMYESRDFGDMPVLGDAPEEAGCDNPDILGHCRPPVGHARGCWILDLLLEKR